jgi:hypothetical protein
MNDRTFVLLVTVLVVFAGFQQWIRHQRRMMTHRERLAAIEKGIELPPIEQEASRAAWNTQRILLFAGLVWVSIGFSLALLLNNMVGQVLHVWGNDVQVVDGMQWIGGALVGIGLSHLIVFVAAVGWPHE